MGGLKPEIRQKVHTHRPETREHIMQLSRDIEAEAEGIERTLEGQYSGRMGVSFFSGRNGGSSPQSFTGSGIRKDLEQNKTVSN